MMGDPKKIAVGIIAKLHPKEGNEGEDLSQPEDQEDPRAELKMIMTDFIHAIHAGDHEAAADAFEAAFECLESSPHEEYPHDEGSEEME